MLHWYAVGLGGIQGHLDHGAIHHLSQNCARKVGEQSLTLEGDHQDTIDGHCRRRAVNAPSCDENGLNIQITVISILNNCFVRGVAETWLRLRVKRVQIGHANVFHLGVTSELVVTIWASSTTAADRYDTSTPRGCSL